ncbi:MAG TPA: efflux RND transporter periplasmic adaptor subunit [Candidatus Acidoferrales bacterium]|nr:efflux RND transporter periplasmic adaptor subunit [Candidatus Acidoferrales bacterium]
MKRIFWIAGALIMVGAVLGYREYSPGNQKKSETELQEATGRSGERGSGRRSGGRSGRRGGGGGVPVTVASVVSKNMPVQLMAVGTVEPYQTVSVRSQITGTLMRVHFKEGQDVRKGDLLFTIDPRPYEAVLKQVQANLAKNMALLANAREQVRRYAELVKKQYVSQEQYDQIQSSANAAEAVVEADRAAVENAKVQLSYCYIYAPVDGRTGDLLVDEGNLVRTNDAVPLVTLNQIMPIFVGFSVPEQHLTSIKEGMARGKLKVQAFIPQNEGAPETGELTFVDNAVDRTTGTIKLKGTFANASRRLWPGQFVRVSLTLADQPNAIVVPSQAVQTGQDGQHVFVLKDDSTVELRPVVVSRTLNNDAVIEKGLKPGEKVVTDGQFLLGPGTKVQVKSDGKKAEVES